MPGWTRDNLGETIGADKLPVCGASIGRRTFVGCLNPTAGLPGSYGFLVTPAGIEECQPTGCIGVGGAVSYQGEIWAAIWKASTYWGLLEGTLWLYRLDVETATWTEVCELPDPEAAGPYWETRRLDTTQVFYRTWMGQVEMRVLADGLFVAYRSERLSGSRENWVRGGQGKTWIYRGGLMVPTAAEEALAGFGLDAAAWQGRRWGVAYSTASERIGPVLVPRGVQTAATVELPTIPRPAGASWRFAEITTWDWGVTNRRWLGIGAGRRMNWTRSIGGNGSWWDPEGVYYVHVAGGALLPKIREQFVAEGITEGYFVSIDTEGGKLVRTDLDYWPLASWTDTGRIFRCGWSPEGAVLETLGARAAVGRLGFQWAGDGDGTNRARQTKMSFKWAQEAVTGRARVGSLRFRYAGDGDGSHRARNAAMRFKWTGDGEGTNRARVSCLQFIWSGDRPREGGERALAKRIRFGWAEGIIPPDLDTESIFWFDPEHPKISGTTDVLAARLDIAAITEEEMADCYALVRAGTEVEPVDAWQTYQKGKIGENVNLKTVGVKVRAGIVRPAAMAMPEAMLAIRRDVAEG